MTVALKNYLLLQFPEMVSSLLGWIYSIPTANVFTGYRTIFPCLARWTKIHTSANLACNSDSVFLSIGSALASTLKTTAFLILFFRHKDFAANHTEHFLIFLHTFVMAGTRTILVFFNAPSTIKRLTAPLADIIVIWVFVWHEDFLYKPLLKKCVGNL